MENILKNFAFEVNIWMDIQLVKSVLFMTTTIARFSDNLYIRLNDAQKNLNLHLFGDEDELYQVRHVLNYTVLKEANLMNIEDKNCFIIVLRIDHFNRILEEFLSMQEPLVYFEITPYLGLFKVRSQNRTIEKEISCSRVDGHRSIFDNIDDKWQIKINFDTYKIIKNFSKNKNGEVEVGSLMFNETNLSFLPTKICSENINDDNDQPAFVMPIDQETVVVNTPNYEELLKLCIYLRYNFQIRPPLLDYCLQTEIGEKFFTLLSGNPFNNYNNKSVINSKTQSKTINLVNKYIYFYFRKLNKVNNRSPIGDNSVFMFLFNKYKDKNAESFYFHKRGDIVGREVGNIFVNYEKMKEVKEVSNNISNINNGGAKRNGNKNIIQNNLHIYFNDMSTFSDLNSNNIEVVENIEKGNLNLNEYLQNLGEQRIRNDNLKESSNNNPRESINFLNCSSRNNLSNPGQIKMEVQPEIINSSNNIINNFINNNNHNLSSRGGGSIIQGSNPIKEKSLKSNPNNDINIKNNVNLNSGYNNKNMQNNNIQNNNIQYNNVQNNNIQTNSLNNLIKIESNLEKNNHLNKNNLPNNFNNNLKIKCSVGSLDNTIQNNYSSEVSANQNNYANNLIKQSESGNPNVMIQHNFNNNINNPLAFNNLNSLNNQMGNIQKNQSYQAENTKKIDKTAKYKNKNSNIFDL